VPAGITDANMNLSSSISFVVSRCDNFNMNRRYLKSGIVEFRFSIWKSFVEGNLGMFDYFKGRRGSKVSMRGLRIECHRKRDNK
jgi:hypothetical protein